MPVHKGMMLPMYLHQTQNARKRSGTSRALGERHLEELESPPFFVSYLTRLLNIDTILVLVRLRRMADDLEDDVGTDSSGFFDGKPRTLSQVIAQAGKPFKKPQVQNGCFFFIK
jgi:hypothetical protein